MMFDTVKCEYELPLPSFNEEEKEDFKDIVWDEVDFQTKSFDSDMGSYEITSDGQIYMRKITREIIEDENAFAGLALDTKDEGIEKIDYSGELEFYHLQIGENKDYWFEFKALFWKGDLKEIELLDFKKEKNEERKKAQGHFDEQFKKAESRAKSWWFPFYKIYRVLLTFTLGLLRKVLEWFIVLLIKIERWMP